MSEDSVSQFIHLLQNGDRDAAAPIWNHFYTRLVSLANRKLKSRVRRVVEGEDVAQSVFDSCFRGLQEGRFPNIHKRDSLWALLITIAERKASNANRKEHTKKAGGGKVSGESVFLTRSGSFSPGLDGIAGDEPTPEFAATFADEVEVRLNALPEDARTVATLLLQGLKHSEIHDQTGFSLAKIERKAARIRKMWVGEVDEA